MDVKLTVKTDILSISRIRFLGMAKDAAEFAGTTTTEVTNRLTMDNNTETPLEVLQPSAIMAMEKAAIDQQIATAHQFPRSLEIFRKRALAMATLDAETADSCIYVRNVGKEQNDKGEWVTKYAEGPSIRLAEIVAVSFGNLRAAVKVVEQTPTYVKCTGMAHDLESNTAMSADVIESTVKSNGTPYSDRQRAVVAKACASKALRDAILKVVPRALCKPILEAAKKVATGADRPIEERRKKAQAWVQSLKIDPARVLVHLGVKGWSEVTPDHLDILTGIKTAMAEQDETIDSAFPPLEKEQKTETKKPAATGHQQATTQAQAGTVQKEDKKGEDNVPMDGKTPLAQAQKPAQDASGANSATQTPSGAPEGQQTPAAEQAKPESAATTPAATPPPEAPAEPDPAFASKEGDTDAVASVKILAQKSGIAWTQFRPFLIKAKLMREDQKDLRELSTAKLEGIAKNLYKWLPDIKTLPR